MPETSELQPFPLRGVDCPQCAAEIEAALRRQTGRHDLTVNLATETVLLPPHLVGEAQRILDRVHPGARIVGTNPGALAAPQRWPAYTSPAADHVAPAAAPAPATGDTSTASPAEEDETESPWRPLAEICLTAILWVALLLHDAGWLPLRPPAAWVVLVAATALAGRRILLAALRNAVRGRFLDENVLMILAVVGAVALGELPEAVGVMLFFAAGEWLQDLAVDRSRRSIRSLLALRPDVALVRRGGHTLAVPPEAVEVGEEILVRPGQRIPLDGQVLTGTSYVDTSPLTGEPVPRLVGPGEGVLAGMVNGGGLLTVRVVRPFAESTAARILRLIEEAGSRKAPAERFMEAFARRYTPGVVLAASAVALLPPLLTGAAWADWLQRALVLLVIACPCALVISIPLGYFGGIGGASRRGILVKGAQYLDALARLETVVLDKTGTLTHGTFEVVAVRPAPGVTEAEVLEWAALAEAHAAHPVAAALRQAYGRPLPEERVSDYQEVAGQGVRARVDGRQVVVGTRPWLATHGVALPAEAADGRAGWAPEPQPLPVGTTVWVALDQRWLGTVVVADRVKEDAPAAIQALRRLGVRRLVMLTGDDRRVAEAVAGQLGLDEVHANVLPHEKVERLEAILSQQGTRRGTTAFVGDGLNDAPVLSRADVGVAMGGLGSAAAIEAADVVLMNDRPSQLATAVALARQTRRIVRQNIALALGVKLAVLGWGVAGLASLWEAVLADVGVALLAVLNAVRVLRAPGWPPGATPAGR